MNPPLRHKMMPDKWYQQLDPGIRFAVRVLHAAGIETCQSCEGSKGHAYHEPTVDLIAGADDAQGFVALGALVAYGLQVNGVSLHWCISNGLPYEKLWRITFWRAYPERANEKPIFTHGYIAEKTA